MSTPAALALSYPEPDVALITFDLPDKGANVLSHEVLEELECLLDTLSKRTDLAGVIFASGKPGMFIAGADIREFVAGIDMKPDEVVAVAERGRQLFARLSTLAGVTIAAVDGVCLGGGTELASWCDRRLLGDHAKVQIGLPEVKLGLFPGWGGTVRLPRLIGLGNAVEWITSGEPVDGVQAVKQGWALDRVPSAQLLSAAVQLVRFEQQSGAYRRDRERWSQPLALSETELMFLGATASALIQQQTKGHYPAPVVVLNLLLESAGLDASTAGTLEAKTFPEVFGTPVNRALMNVFFLSDRNKKDPGIAARVEPRSIGRVGVVGAGIMGGGIAAACVKRDVPVTLTDAQDGALAAGVRRILDEASFNRQTRGPDAARMSQMAPLVQATRIDAEFAPCDLVIEAIVEREAVKRELYARLEPLLAPDAILASNTSAISIGKLAEGLKHPERFVGIHFFNPVRQMPLVEVIRGPRTSDATVASAVAFAKRLGKSPIVVLDGPGFLVNRLLLPYMSESLELVLEGHSPDQVDGAAKRFGMPMGPITLYDVVGLDTALFAGRVMHEAFPERIIESPLLEALVSAGRLGQKSSRGFMRYGGSKGGKPDRGSPDPELEAFVAPLRRSPSKLSGEQMIERLFLPMVLEASRILEEGKVRDARDVDLGLIYGIGFPPFQGGLLHWADRLGARTIVERLRPYEPLGPRYTPTPLLLELARSGGTFYDLHASTGAA